MNGTLRTAVASALLTGALAGPAEAEQPLVKLFAPHVARTAPSLDAKRVARVPGRRPLTGVRTVLPELRRTTTAGRVWMRVALAGRPNSSSGWIRGARTSSIATPWRLSVDLGTRRVTVFHYGKIVRRFPAVVGAPSTPTPTGRFFVEEAMSLGAQVGGPFALATSARSDVLQEFEGGPGQIALHGRNGLGDPLGTAASHGCIRLTTVAITWLSRRIGAGVPLIIRR